MVLMLEEEESAPEDNTQEIKEREGKEHMKTGRGRMGRKNAVVRKGTGELVYA